MGVEFVRDEGAAVGPSHAIHSGLSLDQLHSVCVGLRRKHGNLIRYYDVSRRRHEIWRSTQVVVRSYVLRTVTDSRGP